MGFEEKALLARLAEAAERSEKEAPIKGLPKGKIGNVEISRVIVGSNLFGGGAHARNLQYVSDLMRRYFTDEKIMDTLQLCEENGINTNVGGIGVVNEYNRERGGKMQIIGQLDPEYYDWSDDRNPDGSVTTTKAEIRQCVEEAAEAGCVGSFLLGCRGDRWVKAKRFDLLNEFVSCVKKNGMVAGIGGHDKRVPPACEKAGIDVDFYFKTIHPESYWGAIPEEEKRPFVVDSFDKPWIGYKVLAAGAVHPSEAFKFAFENGVDFVCPGMFDWQVRENVQIAKDALAADAAKNRARQWA
jgi:hypothetical protein